MSIYRNLRLGTAFCLGLALPISAQEVTGETVVATVGDKAITVGHMVAMTLTLPEDQLQYPIEVIFQGILERLIQQEAVSQSVTQPSRRGELQLENERRSLVSSEIVNDLAEKITVTPEAVQDAYEQRYATATPTQEYNASHILVETEDAARAILAELEGGADFAELARQHSTGPTGPGGGNLGWFVPDQMVPEFAAVVSTLEKGQIAPPLQTMYGWHVVQLNDIRTTEVPALDAVKQELEQQIWREALEAEIKALVDRVTIVRADLSGIPAMVLTDPAMLDD